MHVLASVVHDQKIGVILDEIEFIGSGVIFAEEGVSGDVGVVLGGGVGVDESSI